MTTMTELLRQVSPHVDAFCLIVLTLGFLWGLYRGLARMLWAFAGWALGVLAAFYLPAHINRWTNWGLPIWFWALILFLVTKTLCTLIGTLVHRWFKAIGLNWTNRFLGALLGFLQVVLLLFFIWFLLHEWSLVNVFSDTYFYRVCRFIYHWLNR